MPQSAPQLIESSAKLSKRLIQRRLELEFTQGQVAERVVFWNRQKREWGALSRSAYCMYESGDVVPDLNKVERLAEALDCSPAWLAFGARA
ncbi:MAG TPA: helix-turn-helix transcriptional regulator [Chloroflexota bacterium]|nr:helix-turn-helix transcriptional regulator [Chloroflexota bacterium]